MMSSTATWEMVLSVTRNDIKINSYVSFFFRNHPSACYLKEDVVNKL